MNLAVHFVGSPRLRLLRVKDGKLGRVGLGGPRRGKSFPLEQGLHCGPGLVFSLWLRLLWVKNGELSQEALQGSTVWEEWRGHSRGQTLPPWSKGFLAEHLVGYSGWKLESGAGDGVGAPRYPLWAR